MLDFCFSYFSCARIFFHNCPTLPPPSKMGWSVPIKQYNIVFKCTLLYSASLSTDQLVWTPGIHEREKRTLLAIDSHADVLLARHAILGRKYCVTSQKTSAWGVHVSNRTNLYTRFKINLQIRIRSDDSSDCKDSLLHHQHCKEERKYIIIRRTYGQWSAFQNSI